MSNALRFVLLRLLPLLCLLMAWSPGASATPTARVNSIVQLTAPQMTRADGSAYSAAELGISNSITSVMVDTARSQTWLYAPTGTAERCAGADCPAAPLGYLADGVFPTSGNYQHAAIELNGMDDLTHASAYQYARTDYLSTGQNAQEIWTRTYSRGQFDFRPVTAEPITIGFNLERYLDIQVDAGVLPPPGLSASTNFELTMTDLTTGYRILSFQPAELNTHRVVFPESDMVYFDHFNRWLSATSGSLDPEHIYQVRLDQVYYVTDQVPEPSSVALYAIGSCLLVLLVLRRGGALARARAMGAVALLFGSMAQAAPVSTATAGFELRTPQLHLAGTPDTALAMPRQYATLVTEADGHRGGGNSYVDVADLDTYLYSCTGSNCTPRQAALSGDAAAVSAASHRLLNATAADSYHVIGASAVSTAQASNARVEVATWGGVFSLETPDSLVLSFDGRSFAQATAMLPGASANAAVTFTVTVENDRTGTNVLTFTPASLNLDLASGEPGYDSGLLQFSVTTPLLEAGPLYRLQLDYSVSVGTLPVSPALAVPEPGQLAMYCVGLLGLIYRARRHAKPVATNGRPAVSG